MEGGELFSRIQERGDQAFTERGEIHKFKLKFVKDCFSLSLSPCLVPLQDFFFDLDNLFIFIEVCIKQLFFKIPENQELPEMIKFRHNVEGLEENSSYKSAQLLHF